MPTPTPSEALRQAFADRYLSDPDDPAAELDLAIYRAGWTDALASASAGWQDISTAPKDGTAILGYCVHDADPYTEDGGLLLTAYAARAEGLSHVPDGPQVICWDESYDCSDGWEMPTVTIPAWWVSAHETEAAANPTHWMPLPPAPKAAESKGGVE